MPGIINFVIVAAVVALAIVGVVRAVGSATGRRDCCSGARRDVAAGSRVSVVDHDESHSPYVYELRVSGMSCEHCAATGLLPNSFRQETPGVSSTMAFFT